MSGNSINLLILHFQYVFSVLFTSLLYQFASFIHQIFNLGQFSMKSSRIKKLSNPLKKLTEESVFTGCYIDWN